MATKKLKVGDIVKLKSGGPDMTIQKVLDEDYDDSEGLRCQWFAGKKLENGWFPISSVEPIEP